MPDPLKILIAEDENISRVVLEATLKKRGHEVVAVENGRKAWEAFRTDHFHVLIADWLMPEMDGLALCREIRKRPQDNYSERVLLSHGLP
jgi:CheY-like chemotaxis protein